jgi:F-type H+-transporting ATPase subunit delta
LSSKSTFSNSTARSYSLALYELAKEKSELKKTEEDIKSLNQLLNTSYEFREAISNPTISKEDKINIISKLASQNKFTGTLNLFLGFTAKKNRLFFLSKIIKSFLDLVSENKGELTAELTSAKELLPEEKIKIKADLSEKFNSSLNINYKHDADLIAGLIVKVGSIMVDTSIKTKLKKLEKNMVDL